MNPLNVFNATENYDLEGFHNIIVNVFKVILEYAPMLPPHTLFQLQPKILLKVDELVQPQVGITVIFKPIFLIPSP